VVRGLVVYIQWSVVPESHFRFQFAFAFTPRQSGPVKTVTMTMRGCPKPVHEALKKSAKANRRSLNQETLAWLEQQAAREEAERPTSCRELAHLLREFNKRLTAEDRRQLAEAIEEGRRRMAREHLH
jgi:hypothetical protein